MKDEPEGLTGLEETLLNSTVLMEFRRPGGLLSDNHAAAGTRRTHGWSPERREAARTMSLIL